MREVPEKKESVVIYHALFLLGSSSACSRRFGGSRRLGAYEVRDGPNQGLIMFTSCMDRLDFYSINASMVLLFSANRSANRRAIHS